jgi:hypothetical protein
MMATILARGLSKLLLVAGGIIFFFGDRALREIWHFDFVPAELLGIGGGILLMILGGLLQSAAKRQQTPDATP